MSPNRAIRLVAAAMFAGFLLTACGQTSAPGGGPTPGQTRSGDVTTGQPDAKANTLPVRLTREFLTATAARKGHDRFIHSSLIYTPLDQDTYGWTQRSSDGSYSGSWEQMNATQREAALHSVTYGDTIRPETLRFDRAKFPDSMPATGSFSFYFTIETTTGKTLHGWSLGGAQPDNGGVRGHVDRLTYGG
jgi:hypothetical protein